MKALSLWGESALQMTDSIDLTVDSLLAYGPIHRHWAVAWSGGKDSTTLLTVLVYLLDTKRIPAPETLTVLYADTRLELTPLQLAAEALIEELRDRGIEVRVVLPPLDKRFLAYVLGRGVPPPNNNTLRWCTRQIKVDPMQRELERLAVERGTGRFVETERGQRFEPLPGEKVLMLTGVRQGESAIRDGRIAMSCGVNGGECGQGWYQETLPDSLCDTLAPLLHWRVCHVWRWLRDWAPQAEFGDWSTVLIADAYGGEEAEETDAG